MNVKIVNLILVENVKFPLICSHTNGDVVLFNHWKTGMCIYSKTSSDIGLYSTDFTFSQIDQENWTILDEITLIFKS